MIKNTEFTFSKQMKLKANHKNNAFWLNEKGFVVVIDQTQLPFKRMEVVLKTGNDVYTAIKDMIVRGAGTIGNLAAFGIYLSSLESNGDLNFILLMAKKISGARPTAVNLTWAINRMLAVLKPNLENVTEVLKKEAIAIAKEDSLSSERIGKLGFRVIEEILKRKNKKRINILTHCNAGYLAVYNNGTALAPIYEANRNGISVHVWVDETRPRNQGSNLTAWELNQENIDFTIIPDNTGGFLMQKGEVDLVFVGADRVSKGGDVINKIGTYLKALAAKDNNVPFYSLFPSSTIDLNLLNGYEVEIEERDGNEVRLINGLDTNGDYITARIIEDSIKVANYGFDITPAGLLTGLITEFGICHEQNEFSNFLRRR